MIYNLHQYFCNLQNIFTSFRKKNNRNKNNKKTFSIKMKDVGTSKPKKPKRNYNNNHIKLHFLGNYVEHNKLASHSISRDCNVGWKKRIHHQIAKRMGNLKIFSSWVTYIYSFMLYKYSDYE